jgi:ribosomal protein L22
LEVTANNFALRLIQMAEVRTAYVEQIREMSQSIRVAVEAGEMSADKGAEVAHQMRNQIMEMQRARDFDLGRSLARQMKDKGITLEEAIGKAMKKFGFEGQQFNRLTGEQQRQVLMEVIDASGRSRPRVTQGIPRLRWASRGLWLATLAIAAYNIGTAENPWWQTGREAANIAGGMGGGFVGGAAMGAAGGVWAGPVGVAVGVIVGGILGALLADHAYVETAGASDPATRQFVGRFTSFWTGVDETGMAKALANEHRMNPTFVQRVFVSLNNDYNTDADDIALEYVRLVRQDSGLQQSLRANKGLRDLLIQLMDDGWTSGEEQDAIRYLRGL